MHQLDAVSLPSGLSAGHTTEVSEGTCGSQENKDGLHMSLVSHSLPRSLTQSGILLVLVNGFRSWSLFHVRGYVILLLRL